MVKYRGAEKASDGGDGVTTGGAEADFPREGERKRGVLGHGWGQRPIKSHPNRGPIEQGEEDHRDAPER